VNFFERQHAARGTTAKLVALFVLSVVAIVVVLDLVVWIFLHTSTSNAIGPLIAATAVTAVIIGGGTLFKTVALRSGGGTAVALSAGAVPVDPTTSDPQLRRLLNIVEEMSIASGVPVPRVFLLEQEPGINAFAAGYTPADATITVTGGALHALNRDELQGVIGHEFSHILNGDMRLNVKMIGLLYGILLLGLIGLRVLYFSGGGRSRDRNNNVALFFAFALAMTILGFIGQFFASLIKAAVSRQREWLADASSVQFTRQTVGLEGALKKIAGLPTGSALKDKHAASQVSHMLFGDGGRSLSSLFATHPPLLKRIKALDPTFDPAQVEQLQEQYAAQPPDGMHEDLVSGAAGPAPATPAAPGPSAPPVRPAAVAAGVATVTPAHVERAGELSAQLPPQLRTLAGQPSTAAALVLALLLNAEPEIRAKQLAAVQARMGDGQAQLVQQIAGGLGGLAPELRLPLFSLAAPLLGARPAATRDALLATANDLALADGRITMFEYCLSRLLGSHLRDVDAPARRSQPGRRPVESVRDAALTLLAELAAAGNDYTAAAQRAFAAGAAVLVPGEQVPYRPPADTWDALDAGWDLLDSVAPKHKQRLVEAMVAAVREDGALTLHEAELLRTACGLLHCPLPTFVA
jgi:Zn-dependent protease with chaperone function